MQVNFLPLSASALGAVAQTGGEGEGLLAEEEGDEDLGVEEVVAGGDDFGLGAGEGDLGVGAFGDAGDKIWLCSRKVLIPLESTTIP